jgi:hypothetical protein
MSGKKRQRTKNEHYYPRCCLQRFTKDGKTVWGYDKFDRRPFRSAIEGIAQENGFYDLPPDILSQIAPNGSLDSQFAETAFSRVEGEFSRRIGDLIENVERKGITREQRLKLAPPIVVQWMRTREQRETIFEIHQKLRQAEVDCLVRANFPDLPKEHYPKAVCERDNLPAVHVGYIFDEDHIVEFACDLAQHIWVVAVNNTIQPYYTSDHPVVKKSNLAAPGKSFAGIRSPGIEIAFPLSSRYLLVMLERSYFRDMEVLDGRAVRMNPFGVEHYNSLQVLRSYRQVYCEAKEFEQAEGVCRRHPEVCTPERDRLQIDIQGDITGLLDLD